MKWQADVVAGCGRLWQPTPKLQHQLQNSTSDNKAGHRHSTPRRLGLYCCRDRFSCYLVT